MPKRSFESVEEFEAHLTGAAEIIFDGTENAKERPKGYEKQKDSYSGKKGTHTDIALLLSDKNTKIYYVSKLYPGRNVDLGLLKKEFPPEKGWFKKMKLLVDLGFIGIDKLYDIKELIIGKKKPRKSKKSPKPELTAIQKEKNKAVSRERIFVEHAIGKTKKFRILKNRCRIKCENLKNRILGICAGLWNYHLTLST
ncbi:MAG: transposase family protein [Chitinophagales bacterium]